MSYFFINQMYLCVDWGGGGHIGAAGTPLGKVYGILEELDTRMENELTDIDIDHDAKKSRIRTSE